MCARPNGRVQGASVPLVHRLVSMPGSLQRKNHVVATATLVAGPSAEAARPARRGGGPSTAPTYAPQRRASGSRGLGGRDARPDVGGISAGTPHAAHWVAALGPVRLDAALIGRVCGVAPLVRHTGAGARLQGTACLSGSSGQPASQDTPAAADSPTAPPPNRRSPVALAAQLSHHFHPTLAGCLVCPVQPRARNSRHCRTIAGRLADCVRKPPTLALLWPYFGPTLAQPSPHKRLLLGRM